jgi:[ribosomal protein S5]-alanine N-acetyltransferase
VDVPRILSARLDLVSMSPAILETLVGGSRSEAEALLDARLPEGWPGDGEHRLFRLRLEQIRSDAAAQPWLLRALVLRRGREMIGHAGFHGPPGAHGLPSSAVEVGYTVFARFRGRGYATEAAVALLEWAEKQGISHFVASVAPDNEPSLAIVRKLGFVRTGEHWDEEDGLEHVFERTASTRVASTR